MWTRRWIEQFYTGSGSNQADLVIAVAGGTWPSEILTSGRLTIDGVDLDFADSIYLAGTIRRWADAGFTWTDGQKVSVQISIPFPASLRRYDWCYNRTSEEACGIAINHRWERVGQQRNPITVSLDNNGNTEKRCPSTHQIRKATTSGIKCERTYAPVLPAAGALAEAWGVTEIAPPSSLRDGWDGATRSCEPQSRGYVVLTTTRWHGLNQGCHAHSAIGGAHHEHSRQNH